jgi:hypothetical protein
MDRRLARYQNLSRRGAIGITAGRLFGRCQRVIGDLVRQADALHIRAKDGFAAVW